MPEKEKPITKSILLTVKKMLGIAEEYHAFDIDIIVDINTVFLSLNQLGVGPVLPYSIDGPDETWQDFLGEQEKFITGVQTYVYIRVRLMFDPPTNSFLVDGFKKQCEELEWRFTVQPKDQNDVDAVESWKEELPFNGPKRSKNQNESETPNEETISVLVNKKMSSKKSIYDIFS